MRTIIMVLLVCAGCVATSGQTCTNTLAGRVRDKQGVLPGVSIKLDGKETVTDANGVFHFTGLCTGSYQLGARSAGYLPVTSQVMLPASDTVLLTLEEDNHELREVTVSRERMHEIHSLTATELTGQAILQTRGASIGNALKELPGLNTVQNGPNVSKPVIHGLHSNRVLLINNGVRQQGQQWGADHAPEIDPFTAAKITVLKGAASVRYGAEAMAGVILTEPAELPTQKGIHSDVYLVGASNGQSATIAGMLEGAARGKLTGFAWRAQGSAKQAGNVHTPGYYLVNTGTREYNYSLTAGYQHKGWNAQGYYSSYHSTQGVFSGAESGSDSELIRKFKQGDPGTPSYFSYSIDRPYQQVQHELAKLALNKKLSNAGKLDLILARQSDLRKEYDPLGAGATIATDKPQLTFKLVTHSGELMYTQPYKNGWSGNAGLAGYTSGNVFSGTRTLIPNYRDYNGGLYLIECYHRGRFNLEAGARYDYRWLRVYQRDNNTLKTKYSTFTYNNVTGTAGATFHLTEHASFAANSGFAWRPPSIYEMFANGIHFSVARYETGDTALRSERAFNNNLSFRYTGGKWNLLAETYYNLIDNFIYSKPSLTSRRLPSGTFPAFNYVQNNVTLRGLDLMCVYQLAEKWSLNGKATIVRGYNRDANAWLVYMPADRYAGGLKWTMPAVRHLSDIYLSAEYAYTLQQTRYPAHIDYVAPPGAYGLINLDLGFAARLAHHDARIVLSADNVLNTRYREYLDNFRYYCDQMGANYTLRIKYSL